MHELSPLPAEIAKQIAAVEWFKKADLSTTSSLALRLRSDDKIVMSERNAGKTGRLC